MPIIINKEDKQIIEQLNKVLGTSHRSRPFDFRRAEDWIEATVMATFEYLDFTLYSNQLSHMEGELDHSIEVFYPAGWAKIGLTGSTGIKKIDSVNSLLSRTLKAMEKLQEEAETRCQTIWNTVFSSAREDVLKHFFGDDYKSFGAPAITRVIEDQFFEIYDDFDHDGTIDSVDEFVKYMKQRILEESNEK